MVTKAVEALIASIFFSLFIYLDYFGLSFWVLSFMFGLVSIYMVLGFSRFQLFVFGFCSALLWFYWVGFSFRYYDLFYMALPSVLFIGLSFGVLFFLIGYLKSPLLRVVPFIFFDYLAPFGFDWMRFELLFVDTPFGVDKLSLGLVLFGVAILRLRSRAKYLSILFLIFAVDFTQPTLSTPSVKINLTSSSIPQDEKWSREKFSLYAKNNIATIKESIRRGDELILFPESAFPAALNLQEGLMKRLKELSKEITIVAGALYYSDDIFYNTAYIFKDGEYVVAKKSVLVPFGESVPLPSPLDRWVNELFFGGASDFVGAKQPTDFELGVDRFRVAICYEATNDFIYKDAPPYILALSNNAWFTPSIEPTLQKLLLRLYARKFNKIIFHSTNISGAYIVKPFR